ncbi:MAG TPA: glycosyltransferase family 2 protein [Verrucomicrobiae bacterium]|jgi:GT2 family glycosyltransferase|nr:glycosyltransferase family 2 protein [Verrucomicrobiae bacterium]
MNSNTSLSVIICTCNRVASLRQTLSALGKARIPHSCKAEVIVVDNGSVDGTAEMIRNTVLSNMSVVYLFEPKPGKSNALNSGMAMASGEILLLTDDDVAPSEDWIEQMLLCFNAPHCDAAVGKVKLAPDLEHPWLKGLEKIYLAVIDFDAGMPVEIVGANAAFRRSVLDRVPHFDPELGSGALGNAEDTLFGFQLMEAGLEIKYAEHAVVVHHPDKSRLTRGAFLNAARQRARSNAYVFHHWKHNDLEFPRVKSLWLLTKLSLRRILQPPPPASCEGCPHWEWSYVEQLAFCRQYCIERRRPRNYSRHGLKKLNMPEQAALLHLPEYRQEDVAGKSGQSASVLQINSAKQ